MQKEVMRVAVVDDEPLAREKLRTFLAEQPEVELVAECSTGAAAVAAIEQEKPDLVFLDIRMPGVDGFEVLKRLGPEAAPYIIFVTAYDRYAVRAFEVAAVDYLLKPFDRERFLTALQRGRERIHAEREPSDFASLLEMLQQLQESAGGAYLDRIPVRESGRIRFVKTAEIGWLEAQGNYICLHLHGRKEEHLVRESLTVMEEKLNPKQFIRVHRSALINVEFIEELQSWFHGDYRIKLKDGTQVTASRTYRARLKQLFGEL